MEQVVSFLIESLSAGITVSVIILIGWVWLKGQAKRMGRMCDQVENHVLIVDEISPRANIAISQINEIHDWVAREDDEGVKLMYSRNKGLELAIAKLSNSVDSQVRMTGKMTEMLIAALHELKELRK